MGQSAQTQQLQALSPEGPGDSMRDTLRRELRTGDIMSRNVMTVGPHDTVLCADGKPGPSRRS